MRRMYGRPFSRKRSPCTPIGAKRGVGLHPIDQLAAIRPEFERDVEQVRRLRAPQQFVAGIVDARIRQRDAAMDFAAHDVVGIGGERLVAVSQLDAESQSRPARPIQPDLDTDLPPREIRRQAETADARRRNTLEPHGLPDASRPRIPDRVRLELPVLLAPGLARSCGSSSARTTISQAARRRDPSRRC